MKGVLSMVGSLGLSYNRFLFCLGCSSRPITKYFFLTVQYYSSFVPSKLGRMSCWVACVLVLYESLGGGGGGGREKNFDRGKKLERMNMKKKT